MLHLCFFPCNTLFSDLALTNSLLIPFLAWYPSLAHSQFTVSFTLSSVFSNYRVPFITNSSCTLVFVKHLSLTSFQFAAFWAHFVFLSHVTTKSPFSFHLFFAPSCFFPIYSPHNASEPTERFVYFFVAFICFCSVPFVICGKHLFDSLFICVE